MKADTKFNSTREYSLELDQVHPLKRYRDEFYIKEGTIYMDGNSLGLLSKRAEKSLLNSLDDWKNHGIDGWMSGSQPWFDFSEKLGALSAPLVGAKAEEVIVTGSITTNIHQVLSTFYKPEGKRTKILADELNFPSDIYAIKAQLKLRGLDPAEHLFQVKSRDGRMISEEDIIAAMSDDVALVWLPSVLYRSGQLLDMKLLAEEANKRGILIGFDLAHSIGAIPHSLHEWGVDFAVWCNYKYLNSGPGGVGGMFVHERHLGTAPGLAGWFSSKKGKQFDMEHTLEHAETAGAYQIGTPHVLSIAPLLGSLEMFAEAGIAIIRETSLKMTDYMMKLIGEELAEFGFEMGNPREDETRGGHVCLEHDEAARICKALKENNIIPDFRSPNVIRLAPIALYTSYEEIWETVQILKNIMVNEEYKKFENTRNVVA
ncbi:TPA: kynureninase [Salmonella enterica subsp. enterica serovar Typhimurium var. 5-]|uniref:Kynureninase n=1 Tax=Salmonella enterica subsp. enterica serovar Typhimurium var. 5- TaxID=1620419 RepID=A0A740Q4P5_SALTM|nr:kynureninase [Salmonella enterica subsp. enterica serovar Typhimurium var. 5-]